MAFWNWFEKELFATGTDPPLEGWALPPFLASTKLFGDHRRTSVRGLNPVMLACGYSTHSESASERRGNTVNYFNNFYVTTKGRIWLGLSCMCHVRSAADMGIVNPCVRPVQL